jgi:hypothetical protein
MVSHDPSMRPHDHAPIVRVIRRGAARDTHSPITTRHLVYNTRHAKLMRIVRQLLSSYSSRARPFASTHECENARMNG